jgi:predicted ATP-binding protein involved in virulence
MNILNLKIKNFKGIKEQELTLNGNSSVFFGINGAGKSTILRSINIFYSRIVQKIVEGRYKQTINLVSEDIRFGESKAEIEVNMYLSNGKNGFNYKYKRSYERNWKNGTKNRILHNPKDFENITNKFKDLFLSDEKANMPIFVNYGVHRAVLEIPLRTRKEHSFDKLSAFEKSVENKIDFRTFFEWFRNQEDYENEIKANSDQDYIDIALESVRQAIYLMLNGFSNLKVKRSPLRMTISKGNTTLEISQLSDGEKCTIALIGDLARRLALANPSLENPLEGKGVVLIDEIELHMHPSWQRKIIPTLVEIFPKIQFVITTHSPQVLGEIDEKINVFEIQQVNNTLSINKIKSLVAWDSNLILEELMGTSSLNQSIKGNITKMFDLIQERNYNEASKIADEIDDLSNGNNPDVLKARILISRGRSK